VTTIAAEHVVRVPAIHGAGAAPELLVIDDRSPLTMLAILGAGS
jgi:hypothetical protein